MSSIFSPGKLLLTSEYVVLDGAIALALPTKLGQEFFCEEVCNEQSTIIWEAFHQNQLWLKARINYSNWTIMEANCPNATDFVVKTLKNVQKLSEYKFLGDKSYHIKTNLQFPSDYGLGSSSTLMSNLAQWANIDAYLLNEMSLGGSGYDIAVALEKCPILYQKNNDERIIEKTQFSPNFKDELIFIHLNKKQDSREAIELYRSKEKNQNLINYFTEITKEVVFCDDLGDFSALMEQHEKLLSEFLEIPTAKTKYFSDCPVFIKSLGAWGGDFVMSTKFTGYEAYFRQKDFSTILSWNDLFS